MRDDPTGGVFSLFSKLLRLIAWPVNAVLWVLRKLKGKQ